MHTICIKISPGTFLLHLGFYHDSLKNSSIEAPVSSDEAAFSSEIADNALIVSTTAFFEESHVSAPFDIITYQKT